MTRPSVRVTGHDHVVLVTSEPDRALAWYRDRLSLAPEREAEWRAGTVPFVSLRVDDSTVIDVIEGDRTGINVDHVSMRVADDVDLHTVAESDAFDVVAGPMWIWGAGGYGWGLYVRDPDGNTVELNHYGGTPPT